MKKIFLIAASAMMVFASCTKVNVNYPDNGQPQEIALFSVNKNMVKAPVTTAVFPDYPMQVAAYLAGADGATPGEYFGGTTFSKNNDGVWTGGQYWPISTAIINFFAVAPQIEDETEDETEDPTCTTTFAALTTGQDPVKVATTTVTGNADEQFDVMYALAQGTHTAGLGYDEVTMIFKHALSLITYSSGELADGVTINSVTLNNVYFDGTGTFNVPQAKYISESKTDVVSTSVRTPKWDATGDVANKLIGDGILVVPHTYEYDADADNPSLTINYSVSKKEGENEIKFTYNYTYTLPAANTPVTWAPGTKYNYVISITLTQIEIKPEVEEWGTATNIPVAGN